MPPAEAIELQLCELFHCRPSELEEEDGYHCMQLLNLRHWRDSALAFKDNPKNCPIADRVRIQRLLGGDENALERQISEKETLKAQVSAFKQELGK